MKLYLDTSVFGGYFETEFEVWTKKLVAEILQGKYVAIVSDVTMFELETAPEFVKELAGKIISENAEFISSSDEARLLSSNYIKEKVVSPGSASDALHIAIATLNKVDVLASWNFKHIVNYNRIRMYNSVNLKHGYSMIDIRSPRELIEL